MSKGTLIAIDAAKLLAKMYAENAEYKTAEIHQAVRHMERALNSLRKHEVEIKNDPRQTDLINKLEEK